MNWVRSKFYSLRQGTVRLLFTDDYEFSLPEASWAAKATSVSPHVTNFIVVIGSLVGGVSFGQGSWSWGILCGVFIAMGIILDYLRDRREVQISTEKRNLQQQAIKDLVHTLIDTSQGTCDALSIEEKRRREASLAAARKAILSTIRRSIGPENGVRVNFFEVAEDSAPTLRASTYAHEGRSNHRSTRIFDLHDESLKLALCHNQGRFIVDAKAAGLDSELPYQTFATMPVSSENYLYGMITVDSPEAGDINEFEAKEHLNLYASQFALTFMSSPKEAKRLRIGDICNDLDN
ncbi:MAG: hypothetical protein HLX50_18750 [Alteromonadaceae bacterium]|nr:hypothetical protein [Alteromonadaceae bacterium]